MVTLKDLTCRFFSVYEISLSISLSGYICRLTCTYYLQVSTCDLISTGSCKDKGATVCKGGDVLSKKKPTLTVKNGQFVTAEYEPGKLSVSRSTLYLGHLCISRSAVCI